MPTHAEPRSADDVIVRPFRRDDRDQLTALVNAHVAAVVPGLLLSVNTVLTQLEHEPGEFLAEPSVASRRTLVAVQRGRVVAAAHVVVNRADDDVPSELRGRGEVRWLLCWPDAPCWPDARAAGLTLTRAVVALLRALRCPRVLVDVALPAPGLFGTPEQWPHVTALLEDVGFVPRARREHLLLAPTDRLDRCAAPRPDLVLRRTVGAGGTRFAAADADAIEEVGLVEVELRPTDLARTAGTGGWAEVGDLWVAPAHRRRGLGRWLLGEAAAWLRLGHVDRLLDSCDAEDAGYLAFAEAVGFERLTTTTRQWELPVPGPADAGATMTR